ncbi:MAG: hypothetical protein ACRC56_01480 [Bosea sp. (in: a-proteobacteria)]
MADASTAHSSAPWDPGTLLAHLAGEASPVRQLIAAHALSSCAHIVEIGGAGLPLTQFLRHRPASVTVIDPKIEPYVAGELQGHPCDVRHISRKLRDEDVGLARPGQGVALLGMSLKPLGREKAVSAALVQLCAQATRVVIEHQVTLERPLEQLPELIRKARLIEIWAVEFVLHDAAITDSGHARRRLSVMHADRA